MENASKALIIAGGMLLTILIISVLVMVRNGIGANLSERDKAEATEQLSKFNMKYESYNKDIRGIDLRSLINMADDDNLKTVKKIEIEFTVINDLNSSVVTENRKTYSNLNNRFNSEVESNSDILTIFNRRVFRCKGTNLDSDGRINKMVFEEVT